MNIGQANRLETGSQSFNELLGGGIPIGSVTDVYGAAATGKTQFAFQDALFCSQDDMKERRKPLVVFVDCAGSFRPERIAEMAEARGLSESKSLDKISTVYVRSVAEQKEVSERILSSEKFTNCCLLIIDDVTTNFVAEFSMDSKEDENVLISRHYELSAYARNLAYIAQRRNIAVLLTNSIRARISEEQGITRMQKEGETTGEIISQFCLYRLYFSKKSNVRIAKVVQPYASKDTIQFSIERRGIVP